MAQPQTAPTRFYIEIYVSGIKKPFRSQVEDVRVYTARTYSNTANISLEQAWNRVDRLVDDTARFTDSTPPPRLIDPSGNLLCFNPSAVQLVILHKLA